MQQEKALSPLIKRELVQRIVTSDSFYRSERLSSFLLHVCELEIEGRCSELNEKEIGHSVFQLPTDYDPSTDGIVRSHASRLRRKLEMYYQREGKQEQIRIVIPRGGYQPRFEWADTAQPELYPQPAAGDSTSVAAMPSSNADVVAPAPEEPSETSALPAVSRWRWIALAALLFVIALASVFLWRSLRSGRTDASALWKAIFTKDRTTVLVPGDSGVVVWQELQHRNLTLTEYLSSAYTKESSALPQTEQRIALTLLGRRYTSMVDLEIVEKLSRVARQFDADPLLRYARDVRPNDLKHSNVVLIGSSETNPWNQMFQGSQNFVLNKDQARTIYVIENRHPSAGEPAQWLSDPTDQLRKVFCKVSYLPNPAGEGNVLILEGTSMAGTECAWEFVASADRVGEFLKTTGWTEAGIPHFEVLLRTNNLAGDSSSSSLVAWRITQ